jgi:hypothetical protein
VQIWRLVKSPEVVAAEGKGLLRPRFLQVLRLVALAQVRQTSTMHVKHSRVRVCKPCLMHPWNHVTIVPVAFMHVQSDFPFTDENAAAALQQESWMALHGSQLPAPKLPQMKDQGSQQQISGNPFTLPRSESAVLEPSAFNPFTDSDLPVSPHQDSVPQSPQLGPDIPVPVAISDAGWDSAQALAALAHPRHLMVERPAGPEDAFSSSAFSAASLEAWGGGARSASMQSAASPINDDDIFGLEQLQIGGRPSSGSIATPATAAAAPAPSIAPQLLHVRSGPASPERLGSSSMEGEVPLAFEARLPPLNPKLSAQLTMLAAGNDSLFAAPNAEGGILQWAFAEGLLGRPADIAAKMMSVGGNPPHTPHTSLHPLSSHAFNAVLLPAPTKFSSSSSPPRNRCPP